MARLDGKFIKGTAGPVTYKAYRGQQIVQGKAEFHPSSQTTGTKKAASVFGIASNFATTIRATLSRIITIFFDGTMVNRLNSDIVYAMRQSMDLEAETFDFKKDSFARLNGFEFNKNSPLRDSFLIQPEIIEETNLLKINLPEMHLHQDLKFPKGGDVCMINVAVGMFDLTYGHEKLSAVQSTEVKYTFNPLVIPPKQFEFEIEPGCLCIVVISLLYVINTFAGKMSINTKAFNPVAVFRAFMADGIVDVERTGQWREIQFKTHAV